MHKMDSLYCINGNSAGPDLLEKIAIFLEAGGRLVQLRLKGVDDTLLGEVAEKVKALCAKHTALCILNDHPAIAKQAGADGVHLGANDQSPETVREQYGKQFIIGGTANTFERICAIYEAVDYIGLGPFRFTQTKEKLSPVLGLAGYQEIMKKYSRKGMSKPVYAIGGITLKDVPAIMQTGVFGVAVSGAIMNSENIKESVAQFRNVLNIR